MKQLSESRLQVNPIAGLTPDWSDLPRLAKGNNIDFDKLIEIIVENAMNRRKSTSHEPPLTKYNL